MEIERIRELPDKTILSLIHSARGAEYDDMAIVLKERGSTGSKGMAVSAGIIDSGFRGYWFVAINNTTNIPIIISKKENLDNLDLAKIFSGIYPYSYPYADYPIIYPYSKAICQALIEENPKTIVTTTSYEKLKEINSERGTSQLGQSGK